MAGVKGRSGPPGNQNNFRHGLAAIQRLREAGVITETEDDIRTEILAGLIQDKGGEAQISFNRAIDAVIRNNEKARQNPMALAQLDGYKRPLVGSLSAKPSAPRHGQSSQDETLEEIFSEPAETGENSAQDASGRSSARRMRLTKGCGRSEQEFTHSPCAALG